MGMIVDTVKAAAAWLVLAVVVFGPRMLIRADRGLVLTGILTVAALIGVFGLMVVAWKREQR